MREATGGTFLYYIVIFLVTVILMLLVASIACSKAYRVKNRIVDTIEKYECYEDCDENINSVSIAVEKINRSLASIGYQIKKNNDTCPSVDKIVGVNNKAYYIDAYGNDYAYCVYRIEGARGPYYKVISYMYFEIPLINRSIKMPIYGTTKSIYTRNGEV